MLIVGTHPSGARADIIYRDGMFWWYVYYPPGTSTELWADAGYALTIERAKQEAREAAYLKDAYFGKAEGRWKWVKRRNES